MPCFAKTTDGKDRPATVGTNINRSSGNQTVTYRDAKGIKRDAVVIAKGSTSGLKLQVGTERRIVDNVAAMTGLKGTNVYEARLQ